MATVLVTGVGSIGGRSTIDALHDHTDHLVVGVDMDPMAMGLYVADRGRTIPPAGAEGWPDAMANAAADFDVDVVVPLVDEELERLRALESALPESVEIVAPRPDIVDLALDKYRMARWFAERGLAVPRTALATEVGTFAPEDFPTIIKPRTGRGSRGVERLDLPTELDDYLASTDRAPDELVVQQFVEGTEYTTSVVATKDDRLLGVIPKEALSKEGSTVRGVTRRNDSVAESCRRVFEELRPGGPINVQQIESAETGTAFTIEVNPRFSSTACLTVAAGVNELDLLIRDAMGERVTPPDGFTSDLHLVRYTDELYVHERDFLSE